MPVQYIPHPIKVEVTYPVRLLNTNYQNTTLRPRVALIRVHTNVFAANDAAAVAAYVWETGPWANTVSQTGINTTSPIQLTMYGGIIMFIPAGWFYRARDVVAGGGMVTLTDWVEVGL